jgi:drug/metabolite transporter (DMT)-like permease|tara:strand:- start:79 stop:945 length:867 start_codon:yes stop_codon:yes gene_type:complete
LKIYNIIPIIFVILWSSAFITSKIIVDNASPFFSLSFRFIVVSFFFLLFFLIFSKKCLFTFKNVLHASISGLLFHGFYLGGVFYALSNGASASLIALIVSLQPILTSTLARIFLKENLSRIQWFGIFLGFLGALIVILTDLNNDLTLLAFCAGLIGLLSSSLGIIWQKKIVSDLSLSANNFIQALSASIFHFILAVFFENYFINFTSSFIIAMSWQIFAVSLGAFLILMWLLQHNKANEISTLFFLVPPISAIMAFLILDETFVMFDLVGLFISSIGVFVVTKYKSKF